MRISRIITLCILLTAVSGPTVYAAAGKGSYTLFVLNDAAPGMEAEFNRWYDQQHAQDVLINPTYVDSQRYSASEHQLRAGAVVPTKYAIRFTLVTDDIGHSLGYIHDNIRTGRTVPTNSIGGGPGSSGGDFVYQAVTDVHPGKSRAADGLRRFMQVEFSKATSGDGAKFNRLYDKVLGPKLAALPGVVSWQRFELSPKQLTQKMNVAEQYMTLIELALPDAAAIDGLQAQYAALERETLSGAGEVVRSMTYEVFGPLLTGTDVKRERAAQAAAAHPGAHLRPELRASAYIDAPGVDAPGDSPPPARPTKPRLAPLSDREASAEQRAVIEKYAASGHDGNVLRTLARSPRRPEQFFPLFDYLENNSSVPARDRELLILRTAWLTQNAYLWARHADRATQLGLGAAEIRSTASFERLGFGNFDATLLGLADELFKNSAVSDRTWSALVQKYGVKTTMDAVVTVTQMTESALLFNTLGIQPDVGTKARLPKDIKYKVVVPHKEPALTVARVQPVEGKELTISRTLRQHPELASQWYAMPENGPNQSTSLPAHDRELAILRIGWNCQSVYEWAQHVGRVGRARDHGLEPRDIAMGVAAAGWNDHDRTLITAVDEMYRESIVSDATWRKLASRYDSDQLITLIATAARYRRVSMTLNALGVQPAADEERLPVLDNPSQ